MKLKKKLKKMPHTRTRTTPDSSVETTEPKRRANLSSSIDWAELLKDIPPPPPPQSPIAQLFHHKTIKFLAKEIQESPELVQRAKETLAGIPECEEGVQKFSKVVRETWPFLASAIRKAMCDPWGNVIGLVLRFANRDSASQRWAHMKADPSLELANLKPPPAATTTENDILRLFLSILIGYWGDKAELPKLDKAMGRCDAFGFHIYMEENPLPEQPAKSTTVRRFSYEIKDAEDAKDAERVRKWLVTQYGLHTNVDVDDLFEKIKSVLLSRVKIGEERGYFNGSKAMVSIRVINHWSFLVAINLVEEDLWF